MCAYILSIDRKVSRLCFEQGGFFSQKPPTMAKKANVDWNEICRLQPIGGILGIRLGTRLQDEENRTAICSTRIFFAILSL